MSKTNNSPTPDTQIHMENLSIDKMRLTVTNIYPVFQKNQNRKHDRKSERGSIRFSKNMRKSLAKHFMKRYDLFNVKFLWNLTLGIASYVLGGR